MELAHLNDTDLLDSKEIYIREKACSNCKDCRRAHKARHRSTQCRREITQEQRERFRRYCSRSSASLVPTLIAASQVSSPTSSEACR
jgi:hypothetical protein